MPAAIPSEAEVLGYFKSLSNWGRWGQDDQLGAMNFLTTEHTRRAATLVREGVTVTCARTISFSSAPDVPNPPVHYMLESGEGWASGDKLSSRPAQMAIDFFGLAFHGQSVTHIDTPSHFFWEGRMYNGRPAHLVSTSLGATAGSIELLKTGVIARGVLVDVPLVRQIEWVERGQGVMPDDILAAERQCEFRAGEGDILLVRTGAYRRRELQGPVDPAQAGATACQAACLPLFHERRISVLGSDTGNDVAPSGYRRLTHPIHQVGIVAMGLWILDNCSLEELARACQARGRWEFMFAIAPLRIHNGTGSPVNPIAVF